jgi:putative phosphoribosyl transferase
VGEDGVHVLNPAVIDDAGVRTGELDALGRAARANLVQRAEKLRNGRPRLRLAGRTAVIVDDGIATGATMRAACRIARAQGAATVVVATPVAAPSSLEALRRLADEVVCMESPPSFTAVGEWYVDFAPVSDETVGGLLARASGEHTAPLPAADPPGTDADVTVDAGPVRLAGHLCVPPGAAGLVVFVHGSGSSRHSPRNRHVAGRLSDAGLATLLFDLLTPAEEGDRSRVFGIGLLADRLIAVIDRIGHRPDLAGLPVGLFGASTGAAAALWAAADPRCGPVAAVVCRGGRPDLGGERLGAVVAPTLLIVGGADAAVLDLNRAARARLTCPNRLVIVPGATHLFEEPRALDTVADLAVTWFRRYLVQPARSPESVAA